MFMTHPYTTFYSLPAVVH